MTFANDKAAALSLAATITADLAKATADQASLVNALTALTQDPPPVVIPPPSNTESPEGFTVSNTTDVIITKSGKKFGLTAIPGRVTIDGATDNTSGGITKLVYHNGQVIQGYDPSNDGTIDSWWIEPEAGGPGVATSNPTSTTTPPPSTGGDPTPIATLAFNDAAGVFPSNLHAELGGNGWGNGELETYTGRAVNAHCDGNGKFIIVARPENYTGSDGINRNFTSARITTVNSLKLQPGTYVEVPVDYIPLDVLGAWPAVWTVGSDAPWPGGGEIDSPEGNNKHLWQTALHLASSGGNDQQYPWYDAIPMTDGPHVDGFYFDSERVQWYVDRILVRQVVATPAAAAKDSRKVFSGDQPASTSGRVWPFGTHPQYLIFNIAVNDPAFKGATMTIGGPVKAWKNNLPVKIIGG